MQTNAINWFEIPVTDFERAKKFYSTIYSYEMPEMMMGPNRMGFLPHEQGKGVGGAIVQGDVYKPSADGHKIYLSAGDDLNEVLSKVEGAGGKVIVQKIMIAPELGWVAVFTDTEGNQVSIHSMN